MEMLVLSKMMKWSLNFYTKWLGFSKKNVKEIDSQQKCKGICGAFFFFFLLVKGGVSHFIEALASCV